MFPLPLVLEKFVDYINGFVDTHGWQGVAVFLMGCYTIGLVIITMVGELT